MVKRRKYLWIAVFGAMVALYSGRVDAANLALEVNGAFGPTSTLNGAMFGAETPFSFRAVFDPAHNLFHVPGAGIFAVTHFTITIGAHGTFTGIPNIDLNAVVSDPTYKIGDYAAGLVDFTATSFFLNKYSAVASPLLPPTPTPTTFLDYLGQVAGVFPYVIPLSGGAGDLAINDFGDAAPTSSLVAVPEPSSLVQAEICGLAFFVLLTIRNPRRYGGFLRYGCCS
jgi:hypothetical protein